MRRAAKTDANHQIIRSALLLHRWHVFDLAAVGSGYPDLMAIKNGRVVFCEVKDGGKPPSKRQLTPAQERVFRAVARAHLQTGAPISTHTTHWGELGLEQLALLAEEGVDPQNVIVGHLGDRRDIEIIVPIAKKGAWLSIDNIGYHDYQKEDRRAQNVIDLMAAGYRSQILLSMDIATLNDLHTYGGKGFDYLLLTFIPLLRELGATDEDVHALLVENPSRALAFTEPKRPRG